MTLTNLVATPIDPARIVSVAPLDERQCQVRFVDDAGMPGHGLVAMSAEAVRAIVEAATRTTEDARMAAASWS
jgi:hypothetical protein